MKRTIGKLITMLLCLTMILSLVPVTALASQEAEDQAVALPGINGDSIGDIIDELGKLPELVATPSPDDPFGTVGTGLGWYLSLSTGMLVISGKGAIPNYGSVYNAAATEAPWYAYRGKIKSVVMDPGITDIGAFAFNGLSNVTSVTMPAALKTIGASAFYGCGRLSGIELPASVTKIGIQAFNSCSSLTKVVLPAGITEVASAAFANCSALKEIVLPESVTKIGTFAFLNCKKLANVTLPAGLTTIEYEAFRGCAALTKLEIPASVTSIGRTAFAGSGLQSFKVPAVVTTIDGMFTDCAALQEIYLPLTVEEITAGSFAGCTALTDVYYGGSKLEWKEIAVGENNDKLLNASFHYNTTGLPESGEVVTPTPTTAPTPTVAPTVTPEPTPVVTPTPTAAPTPTVEPTVTPDPICYHDNKFTTVAPTCTEDGYGEIVCTLCGEKWPSTYTDSVAWELAGLFYNPIYFWDYPEYIPSRINPLFFDESDHYGDYKDVPAAEYEAVMAEYFVVTDELLDELRYHTEFKREPDCMRYDAATDSYHISKTGGWGGGYNGPRYQGYTVSGSTYEVYFAECKYVYLKDFLPEGTNVYDYWEEQGNPESLDYAGYTFTMEPDSSPVCLAEVLNNGRKGIAEKNGDTYRIVDIVDYTEADLPDSFVTIDTKALGHNYVDGKCTRCGLTDSTVKPTPTVAPTTTPEVTPTVEPTVTPEPTPEVTPTPTAAPTPTPTPFVPVEPTVNPELDPETCKHTLFFVAGTSPTCTEPGYTGKVICNKGCGKILQPATEKPALGHKYNKGTCTRCGHVAGTPEVPPAAGDTPFTDMTVNDWFYEPVRWAVAEGITSGTSATTFSPDQTCTRAQIVTFLWAAAGKPEPTSKSPFADVKSGDWYYKPVIWAVENDITSGTTPSTFSPNIPCSRAQVVALLYKAMGSPEHSLTESPFADVTEANYFYDAVLWAVENGIASGISANKFGASQPCTRAQIATFLYKAYN